MVAVLLSGAGSAWAAVYVTAGYVPGTAGQPGSAPTPGEPAMAGELIQAFLPAALTSASGTWRRPIASVTEINPSAPLFLDGSAGSLYWYSTVSFTSPNSQVVDYFQSASFDGFLHVYSGAFNSAQPLTNLVGGDDDMTTLLGGVVPGSGQIAPSVASASGLRFPVTAGTTYTIVSSSYATTATVPANGGMVYGELRRAGTEASAPTGGSLPAAGTQGSPALAIVDNNPAAPTVLTLSVASHGTITSFNRFNLIDATHTFVGDLVMTLAHAGVTVTILNRQGSGGDWLAGLTYGFSDAGAAYPVGNALGNVDYRSAGLLSAFAGLDVFGDWVLTITDHARADVGSVSAFAIDVSAGVAVIAGDYNGDGFVDAADYTVWADHFGQTGTGIAGDGNGDGRVDAADYTVWADHFGQGTAPGASGVVPEPVAATLLAPTWAVARRRRR